MFRFLGEKLEGNSLLRFTICSRGREEILWNVLNTEENTNG